MCERRLPWQQSPHGRRFFSSITESLPPVWTQLTEAQLKALAQVGSAHSGHTGELQSDVRVHRDVHGPGAEGGQQRTGGALWTSRSPRAQRLLPVRPVLPVPPSALSPLSSSDSAHFSHQGALQGASGGADQPAGL